MTSNLFLSIGRLVRRLRAWPQRHVLRATGEIVEILELQDRDGRQRCLVELRGGRQIMVTEAELGSELAMRSVAMAVCSALALAGILVGSSLGMARGDGLIADVATCQAIRHHAPLPSP